MADFDINNAPFLGKFSFMDDSKDYWYLGGLKDHCVFNRRGVDEKETRCWFNLYGDLENGFVIQASNWMYIRDDLDENYVADRTRTDYRIALFKLDKASGGQLMEIPPRGRQLLPMFLTLHQLTPGFAEISSAKTTNGKPLTGVCLRGQELNEIDFANSDISFADFSHATLSNNTVSFRPLTATNTIFDYATLTDWIPNNRFEHCSFDHTTLNGGSLFNVVLANCTFDTVHFGKDPTKENQVILHGTNFTGSTFRYCTFNNAFLEEVIFDGADISYADFSYATLNITVPFQPLAATQTKFDYATLNDWVPTNRFEHCSFIEPTLNGGSLLNIVLANCTFVSVDFGKDPKDPTKDKQVVLHGTDFTGSTFIKCNFYTADLEGVVFIRASFAGQELDGIDFSTCDISYANFSHATLNNTVLFRPLTATHTIFDYATLNDWVPTNRFEHCSFIQTTLNGGSLLNIVLANCTFDSVHFGKDPTKDKQVVLHGTDFTGSTFNKCTFNYAELEGVIFNGADISNADFSYATLNITLPFQPLTATKTKFDYATLNDWIPTNRFEDCSFDHTTINGGSLLNLVLSNCTFNTVKFGKDSMTVKHLILHGADFTGSTFINCNFDGADLEGVIFKGAVLKKGDFSKTLPGGKIKDLRGATLTGATFSGLDLSACHINTDTNDARTNFTGAWLEKTNFTGNNLTNAIFVKAHLTNAKLDNTTLDGVQMSHADLNSATATGGVSMIGADLGNANLQFAKFPGAQLGAKKTAFNLPLTEGNYLDAKKIPSDLPAALKLSTQASVTIGQAGLSWEITDGQKTYPVKKTETNLVLEISRTAAVLTNAYMENTNFEQANMYAVEMSGVYWFGSDASADGAVLSEANLSNSYLINMQIKEAKLQGASLDNARLIGTVFDGALLSPDTNLKQTSFANASMQGATFTGTNLFNTNLTDAAFALEKGVPLFQIEGSDAVPLHSIIGSLNSRTLSDYLQTAFKNNAYPLIVVRGNINVNTSGSSWTINNIDTSNTAQVGYGNFNLELIKKTDGASCIQVYGATPLLVLKSDGAGGQIQHSLDFAPTGVTKEQMNEETICPSGSRFSIPKDQASFEEMMTASLPPKPPTCSNCWGKGE